MKYKYLCNITTQKGIEIMDDYFTPTIAWICNVVRHNKTFQTQAMFDIHLGWINETSDIHRGLLCKNIYGHYLFASPELCKNHRGKIKTN